MFGGTFWGDPPKIAQKTIFPNEPTKSFLFNRTLDPTRGLIHTHFRVRSAHLPQCWADFAYRGTGAYGVQTIPLHDRQSRALVASGRFLNAEFRLIGKTLFVDGATTAPGKRIRAKISEILLEYSYLSDNESTANDQEEPWPTMGRRRIARNLVRAISTRLFQLLHNSLCCLEDFAVLGGFCEHVDIVE